MNGPSVLLRKNEDSVEWQRAVKVHETIRQLGDGCEVKDIAILLGEEKNINNISSIVSKMVLADPPVLSSVRAGHGKHTEIKVLLPLPDVLYDKADREKINRGRRTDTERIIGLLPLLTRKDLLMIKIEINKLLESVKE